MRKLFTTEQPDGQVAELFGSEQGDLEIPIDGIQGLMVRGPQVKLNLYQSVFDEDNSPTYERREVACRISMTLPTFFAIRDWFDQQCQRLENLGVEIEEVKPKKEKKKDLDK